jgi:uncharacterized membrane protein YgdD (TMEM256/DUF423 family)
MKKNTIPALSIAVYCLAFVLVIYSVWAIVNTSQYISSLIDAGQLVFSGNEFEIVSYHLSTYGQYILFAAVLFMAGWILQKVQAKADIQVEIEEPAEAVVELPTEE